MSDNLNSAVAVIGGAVIPVEYPKLWADYERRAFAGREVATIVALLQLNCELWNRRFGGAASGRTTALRYRNCQAGYQTLMVAMLRPDLFGVPGHRQSWKHRG